MKILVVGSGGREHAIIRALKKSPKAEMIYALPGNGGMAADAICVEGSATDIDRVVSFSKENGIDFVVVAPDNPLVLGMVDALNEAGIATFGPRANAAILEGSKVFSKNLMKKYNMYAQEWNIKSHMQGKIVRWRNFVHYSRWLEA